MTCLSIDFVDSITEIGAEVWNNLTGTDNPFMRYEFLAALEATGCTTRETGWQPSHVVVKAEPSGQPVAVVPLYEKTNSSGEYVFDWSWAHAYHQHGFKYYPKFVTSAPFTPSVGERFFIAEDHGIVEAQSAAGEEGNAIGNAIGKNGVAENSNTIESGGVAENGKAVESDGADNSHTAAEVMGLVRDAVQERAERIGASSWHILFPTEKEHELLSGLDLMPRDACQFHWYNRDYKDFDDFLAAMSSRKRKNIRKERAKVQEADITFKRVEGADISEALWHKFYRFYQSTYLMRGMQGYLTEAFFNEVSRTMPEQLFMICAQKDGETIAAALFFKSSTTLFGRYWGSAEDYQFLHFETCFYQGQDYAIEHGFRHFDSGAQGEHKIQRGFEPILTHSNHWIAHPAFRAAINGFLTEEAKHIRHYQQQAASLLPFKND